MEQREKEHLLALKVMRLTRPSLYRTHSIAADWKYFPLNHLYTDSKLNNETDEKLENNSSGNLLMLPQSFGNIYLGETFSCYMSVHNDSLQCVTAVQVQADLQVGMQKIVLAGQRGIVKGTVAFGKGNLFTELSPDESLDDVIHHEVKEIGTHILACTVSYTSTTNDKLHFRKFFKFQVSKPLDVKTKSYLAEDFILQSDEVYLEAPLQNITYAPMCLEKVALEPSNTFSSKQLNLMDASSSSKSVFGEVNCLNPLDSRQYLFYLLPKFEPQVYSKLSKNFERIGKLDIVWRTGMGEKGRLQTSQLDRMTPSYGEIQLIVDEIPSFVALERSFPVCIKITNTSVRVLDLLLKFQNSFSNGILWQGVSGQRFSNLEKGCAIFVQLEAVPIKLGLQNISGLIVKELFLNRLYDFNDVAQVFVTSE